LVAIITCQFHLRLAPGHADLPQPRHRPLDADWQCDRSTGQLDFEKLNMGQGLYAPDISWHDRTFYIVNTCVGRQFCHHRERLEGPWSDPVWLPELADAIDASLFFDTDGTAWIVNNGPPVEVPRYSGHRAIWMQQFDANTLKTFGPRRVLVDGGVHPELNPIWIEGPHIFRKDRFYYLICAEGGTAEDHSEVVFRSDKVAGPYVPLASNPILTQRDLLKDRPSQSRRPATRNSWRRPTETGGRFSGRPAVRCCEQLQYGPRDLHHARALERRLATNYRSGPVGAMDSARQICRRSRSRRCP
jgi:beta-xylosidase